MEHGHGTVVACEGPHALVLFRRDTDGPCGACPGSDLCSTIPPEECERKVRAVNRLGARPGDTVSVRLADDGQLGWAMLHVFGFPLVAAALGLAGGFGLARAAGLAAGGVELCALAGLVGSLVLWIPVSRFLDRIRRQERMFLPEVVPPREPGRGCGAFLERRVSCFEPKDGSSCLWGGEAGPPRARLTDRT